MACLQDEWCGDVMLSCYRVRKCLAWQCQRMMKSKASPFHHKQFTLACRGSDTSWSHKQTPKTVTVHVKCELETSKNHVCDTQWLLYALVRSFVCLFIQFGFLRSFDREVRHTIRNSIMFQKTRKMTVLYNNLNMISSHSSASTLIRLEIRLNRKTATGFFFSWDIVWIRKEELLLLVFTD